eukprot:5407768-Pleurochrysis_carterae.AAC.1
MHHKRDWRTSARELHLLNPSCNDDTRSSSAVLGPHLRLNFPPFAFARLGTERPIIAASQSVSVPLSAPSVGPCWPVPPSMLSAPCSPAGGWPARRALYDCGGRRHGR